MNVAILGASIKPERYSNQAVRLLAEKGHAVFPSIPPSRKSAATACSRPWPTFPTPWTP